MKEKIKTLLRYFKMLRNVRSYKMADGTKAKRKIMLYGFFGNNVGDDLFFDYLFRRYPDTLFVVFFLPHYSEFFSRYNNVRFYDMTRSVVTRLNAYGEKHKKPIFFEQTLLRFCDGAVHIGGSVYQQICDWEYDLKIRDITTRRAKRFFAISNNFGPYHTEGYIDFWRKKFINFDDICFRDKYSYNLFCGKKNIRYAPDLLFSYPVLPKIEKNSGGIAISVIDTSMEMRSIDKNISDKYFELLTAATEHFLRQGKEVTLLNFCLLEGDINAVNRIISALPEDLRERVKVISHSNDIAAVTKALAASEYIVATRFHASVLGFVLNKKVLPLCYSEKTVNMLTDLKLNSDMLRLSDLENLSTDDFIECILNCEIKDISGVPQKSEEQFAGLDRYIKKHGGTIIKNKY